MTTKKDKDIKIVPSPRSGVVAPVDRRFGQPNGNTPGGGSWKKTETLRYRLQELAKMPEDKLKKIVNDKKKPMIDRRIAKNLLTESNWKVTDGIITRIEGRPKETIEHISITPPKPLEDLTKNQKEE